MLNRPYYDRLNMHYTSFDTYLIIHLEQEDGKIYNIQMVYIQVLIIIILKIILIKVIGLLLNYHIKLF